MVWWTPSSWVTRCFLGEAEDVDWKRERAVVVPKRALWMLNGRESIIVVWIVGAVRVV